MRDVSELGVTGVTQAFMNELIRIIIDQIQYLCNTACNTAQSSYRHKGRKRNMHLEDQALLGQ